MSNEAIATTYPQNLVDLGAHYGRFSADGTLAIVTNGIATGDPEQVWLYNLQTKSSLLLQRHLSQRCRL
ncbi:hypothetical protein [Tunturiibacter gelidiferens]|uniref:hypothetical protein n=1 Tax=Tunturiibacter gelidiferens TaxID=3069689 RepID=UPI003D9BA24D